MDKTILTVIRHGETEWNASMILQGQKDSPLSDLGIKQVKAVAEGLRQRKFDVLITSDLGRAVKTAEMINTYHHMKLHIDPALRERSFGRLEQMSKKELHQLYPEVMEQFVIRNPDFQIPEGESLKEFNIRISKAVKNITDKYRGKHLLVVAHGGILDCMIRWCFNYPISGRRAFKLMNTSVNVFEVSKNEWTLIEWGNTDHLNGIKCNDDAH